MKLNNPTIRQIKKLMATGQTEAQAIDSVKRMSAEMQKNPDMFLQPYTYENGKRIPNPAFRRRYGDPDKILADTQKNVGRTDYQQKVAEDAELADRINPHRKYVL